MNRGGWRAPAAILLCRHPWLRGETTIRKGREEWRLTLSGKWVSEPENIFLERSHCRPGNKSPLSVSLCTRTQCLDTHKKCRSIYFLPKKTKENFNWFYKGICFEVRPETPGATYVLNLFVKQKKKCRIKNSELFIADWLDVRLVGNLPQRLW